jgi:hypothetical protein
LKKSVSKERINDSSLLYATTRNRVIWVLDPMILPQKEEQEGERKDERQLIEGWLMVVVTRLKKINLKKMLGVKISEVKLMLPD